MERYGGFGRCRDLGQIQWQIAMIMDHFQSDNLGAVRDAVALLMVCLEQASLDGGKLDIGLLLALQEDPPVSVFTNRTMATFSRQKAFAPLADQKWVANALTFIKELDAIATKRADATQQQPHLKPDQNPTSKKAPKKPPKAKAWQKREQQEEEEA